MPPRSSPSITSTTKRAKCLSGSHSSTDGGRRNAVRRSKSRKLLIAIKPPFGANQWRDSSENQRRWVKSDRLLEESPREGRERVPKQPFLGEREIGFTASARILRSPRDRREGREADFLRP